MTRRKGLSVSGQFASQFTNVSGDNPLFWIEIEDSNGRLDLFPKRYEGLIFARIFFFFFFTALTSTFLTSYFLGI